MKSIDSLTDRALVTEYQRTHARIDKLETKIIDAGLGHLRPSDMRVMADPPKCIRDRMALVDRALDLRAEAERRYGPGMITVDQLIWRTK